MHKGYFYFLSCLLLFIRLYSVIPEKSQNICCYNREPTTELGKRLKKEFDELLEKIRDSVDKGKALKEEYLEKVIIQF